MVDAIVADLANGLLRKALSLAAEELIQAWGLHENLKHLQNRLELVHDLLSDADAKQVTMNTVRRWLNKLLDVADDADLLEDLNHRVLRQKALALESHGKVRDFFSHPKTSILHRFKARHVRIQGVEDIKQKVVKGSLERVQTLYVNANLLGDMLPNLNRLSVLVLTGRSIRELPISLGKLKYLKYLDISSMYATELLPDFMTKLYNLQTLRVCNAKHVPRKIGNLINLRHARFGSYCIFPGIERMTSLQTLSHFVVDRDEKCHLGELGGLGNLKGKLDLYGLRDVKNMEEAKMAKLCEKTNLWRLMFCWNKKI